jgi:hypothetical protein
MKMRDQRKPGWFWAENELLDVFLPLIGVHAVMVYITLCRNARGSQVDKPLRELARLSGMSAEWVRRCLQVMVAIGMVGERRGRPKTPVGYDLLDLKETLALGEGELRRRMESVHQVDRLTGDKDVEKPVGVQRKSGKSVHPVDRLGGEPWTNLSTPGLTDLSTQSGQPSILLKKTIKLQEETPLPPLQGGDDQTVKAEEIKTAGTSVVRVAWVGVMDYIHGGLMDASRASLPHLRSGLDEWREIFEPLDFDEYEGDGENGLVLVLTTPDPKLAAEGLKRYARRVHDGMVKYFGREVQLSLRKRAA